MKYNDASAYKILSVHEDTHRPTIYANYLTKQGVWRHSMYVGPKWSEYGDQIKPNQEKLDALANEDTEENRIAAFEAIMRNNHFCMLNSIPVVAGTKWVITEDIYWYFLEILPPMEYAKKSKGFAMSEFSQGNVTSAYYHENGHYWHEYVEYSRG